MAAYGTGAVFQNSAGKLLRVPGGLSAAGMTLLLPDGVAVPSVTSLDIILAALSWCYLDEAERELERARKMFDANLPVIKESWLPANNERRWQEHFTFYAMSLAKGKKNAVKLTQGFLPALVSDPILRDRFNWLIWMANNEFAMESGYFSGEFREQFFRYLGGMGEAQVAMNFAQKVERLVSRALRITHQSFRQGVHFRNLLSAGWVSALEQVPREAGFPERIEQDYKMKLARGEAESAQLVLATQKQPLERISVQLKPRVAHAPEARLFLVDYVHLTESASPQMPLCRGGDSAVADILKPYQAGSPFSIASYNNQSIWIDVRSQEDTLPGSSMSPWMERRF